MSHTRGVGRQVKNVKETQQIPNAVRVVGQGVELRTNIQSRGSSPESRMTRAGHAQAEKGKQGFLDGIMAAHPAMFGRVTQKATLYRFQVLLSEVVEGEQGSPARLVRHGYRLDQEYFWPARCSKQGPGHVGFMCRAVWKQASFKFELLRTAEHYEIADSQKVNVESAAQSSFAELWLPFREFLISKSCLVYLRNGCTCS